jgi:hypothetical protein
MHSPFWFGFTDASTNQATYSIALSSVTTESKVSIGASLDPYYQNAIGLSVKATDNTTIYSAQNISFGKVVYNTDGVA